LREIGQIEEIMVSTTTSHLNEKTGGDREHVNSVVASASTVIDREELNICQSIDGNIKYGHQDSTGLSSYSDPNYSDSHRSRSWSQSHIEYSLQDRPYKDHLNIRKENDKNLDQNNTKSIHPQQSDRHNSLSSINTTARNGQGNRSENATDHHKSRDGMMSENLAITISHANHSLRMGVDVTLEDSVHEDENSSLLSNKRINSTATEGSMRLRNPSKLQLLPSRV